MVKVGVTGGIGSGKSILCKAIEVLGYPVYYADERAKELTNSHPIIKEALIRKFGDEIYQINGEINKVKLAELIFNNKENLAFTNTLIHPIVIEDFVEWMQKQKHANIVFQEAALIFESGLHKRLDFTISIISPEEIRIKRVMERDGVSKEMVLSRIKNQISDAERIKLSDFIINNDGKNLILPELVSIIDKIRKNKVKI